MREKWKNSNFLKDTTSTQIVSFRGRCYYLDTALTTVAPGKEKDRIYEFHGIHVMDIITRCQLESKYMYI